MARTGGGDESPLLPWPVAAFIPFSPARPIGLHAFFRSLRGGTAPHLDGSTSAGPFTETRPLRRAAIYLIYPSWVFRHDAAMKFFLMLVWTLAGWASLAARAEVAEGRAEAGSFSWTLPPGWRTAIEGNSFMLIAPMAEGEQGLPMLVKYSAGPKRFADGAELKALMDAEIAKSGQTTGPEEQRDSCELVMLGGVELAKTRASVWQTDGAQKHVYKMVSYVRVGETTQEELMVSAPAENFARWKEQVESVCATVKARKNDAPEGAAAREAGPFTVRIPRAWMRIQGRTVLEFREMNPRTGGITGVKVTYEQEEVATAGAAQLMPVAEQSLGVRAAGLRDLVGVLKGSGGPLRRDEIHEPAVEIARSGGVELVKGRFEEVDGEGDARLAMKAVALMLPDGSKTHVLKFSAPLAGLDVMQLEELVNGVTVNAKAKTAPAAPQTQVFKAGALQCTLPGSWLKTDNPSIMAGPSQAVLGTNVETAVVAVSQPKSFASLKQMKNEMDRRLENSMEQLRPLVGGAIGADGGLRAQELRNARAELITLGGTKVLRVRALETRDLNGIRFMVDAISYWLINGDRMDSLQIITPLATKEGAVVDKIMASMKVTGTVKE